MYNRITFLGHWFFVWLCFSIFPRICHIYIFNVNECSWTFINGSSSQFMNCVHELFIKTVHEYLSKTNNEYWWTLGELILFMMLFIKCIWRVWWTVINFYELGRNNSVHSLSMKVHAKVSWTLMNYYELDKSWFGSWLVHESSHGTVLGTVMNCYELDNSQLSIWFVR